MRAVVVNAPEGYVKTLGPLPEGVTMAEKLAGKFDWAQLFVKNKAELEKTLPADLSPGCRLGRTMPARESIY